MKALVLLLVLAGVAEAAPQGAEKFTHIATFSLADLPTFDALAKTFGPSAVIESGDASEYDARVCYKSLDNSMVVAFFHGEVHWGFTLRTPGPDDARCPASAELTANVANIAGVTLGMKRKDYERLVGRPSRVDAQHVEHDFQYVHVLSDEQLGEQTDRARKNGYKNVNPEDYRRWDVIISLDAAFKNERLASFTVTRVETN